ncbi:aminoglycoside 6-adenylyltransferase [Bdellovibrio sp. 22V]|uniref:aminoglycoside 6-adenylyltransferase n=1 Tax=Bdellovibrio sp. 22V TaxID=3044166 RepID=UPI0025426D2B|nr:aminoglycoside 6-adenylyltransferase [Bdellovibrio sp. 22V]WII71147.1 aminoglycoside 6-adenylyltransferase [Bdellovibrio sp. 22V]
MLPKIHQQFLDEALSKLQADLRILGVAGAGSLISGKMDEYSDLDLIVVVPDTKFNEIMAERFKIVAGLGNHLTGFTGEHVGEPRLIISLFDEPLLHVDVKFVSLSDFGNRVENPVVLWERDTDLSDTIQKTTPHYPTPDLQWIEDRFWIWIHYAALRLGRGELFEVIDHLSFMRQAVFGPLSLVQHGHLPQGVRRLEMLAPRHLEMMKQTVAGYERSSCVQAIRAAIELYRTLRSEASLSTLVLKNEAESAAVAYFEQVAST